MHPIIDLDIEDREIELRIAEMTAHGAKYYPFTRNAIAEAVSEMPDTDFAGLDPFGVIKQWCIQYWNDIAKQDAEQSVLRSRA